MQLSPDVYCLYCVLSEDIADRHTNFLWYVVVCEKHVPVGSIVTDSDAPCTPAMSDSSTRISGDQRRSQQTEELNPCLAHQSLLALRK